MNFNWVALVSLFSLGVYGLVENVEPISPRTTKVSVDAYLDKDFYFGYASAAAQNEGAVDVDGKSKSQWDVFAETPGRIFNMEKPNDTIDEYFNYKETVELLKMSGANSYRLSIAWTRLVPDAVKGSRVNPKAVLFYRNYLSLLRENGIEPFVTLYHWDIPASLNQKYKGLLNTARFSEDYLYFANAAFENFGDLVKYWVTFNEPSSQCLGGYGSGELAPGASFALKAPFDAFRCGHTIMVSHAKAVKLFREKYQPIHGGKIGIVNILQYGEPVTNDPLDVAAALASMELSYCWFQDTVTFGDYPEAVKKLDFGVGALVPKFTEEEKQMLKGSTDFVGVNHYTSWYIGNKNFKPVIEEPPKTKPISNPLLPFVATHYDMNKNFMGMQGASIWLFHYPKGFRKSLEFIQKRYNNPDIYVTENGFSVQEEFHMDLELKLNDVARTYYFKTYLAAMREAIKESGAKVKGYFAWTLTDNFEWAMGYSTPFGVSVFDKATGKRYWKDSAFFLKSYFEQAIQK